MLPQGRDRERLLLRASRCRRSAAFAYAYPEHITKVTAPILVFNSQDDLWHYTPRIRPYLKNGRVRDLPGWSHQMLDFSTAELAAMVRGFLEEDRFPAWDRCIGEVPRIVITTRRSCGRAHNSGPR